MLPASRTIYLACLLGSLLGLAKMPVQGQNLHFNIPRVLLSEATTDKAVDITNFKGSYFLTWKEPGRFGKVRLSYLGRLYDTAATHHAEEVLETEQSAFAPVFRVWNDRLYLFWIAPDGSIKYILNNSDTDFVKGKIHVLVFKERSPVGLGINAAAMGGQIVVASHAQDRRHMVYTVVEPGADGLLPVADMKTLPEKVSGDYPFIVSLNDSVVQFTWKGDGNLPISRGNYNTVSGRWVRSSPIAHVLSGAAPAVYHLWNSKKLFYIWKGAGKDRRIRYSVHSVGDSSSRETLLPEYFNTDHPVSICNVDGNNFLVSFVGENGRIYVSRFANYNPATWMEDILLKDKGHYTLQDIVIPGSHDAGMSVLTAAGGSQSGTINQCNTLTQGENIEQQLQAGLRMFDLRVGTYGNKLYLKHCSSDCMADAIGGGYGEKLDTVLDAIRKFLTTNRKEIVLLTFSHFCERETPVKDLAAHIVSRIGQDRIYRSAAGGIQHTPLSELAGKVIITFDGYARTDRLIDSCSIALKSSAFINFRREYAATNDIPKLLSSQESWFRSLEGTLGSNDLVRLDWQLSQSADEAAMICNDFQDEKTSPLLDAAMLLTNVVRKHKSILDLSIAGNVYLPSKCNEWIDKKIITGRNKPNILYVDAAGDWITDYCVFLNQSTLYQRK